MTNRIALASIDWHDLPIEQVRISEEGVVLVVTPCNEAESSYDRYEFKISDAEVLNVSMRSALSRKDLASLEVSRFDYSVAPSGLITGKLGVLPGNAGYWELDFTNARWSFERVPTSSGQPNAVV